MALLACCIAADDSAADMAEDVELCIAPVELDAATHTDTHSLDKRLQPSTGSSVSHTQSLHLTVHNHSALNTAQHFQLNTVPSALFKSTAYD